MAKLSVEQALAKAESHIKKGEVAEAQTLYATILKAFPNNKKAQKGMTALGGGQRSAAEKGPPQAVIDQLMSLYKQGQLEAVSQQAQNLTAQYPKAVVLWNMLGASSAQLGKFDQAIGALKEVIFLNPNQASSHYNLGNALKDQGKLEEAINSYAKALEIKPDYEAALNNMKALVSNFENANDQFKIARELQTQGKLDEAISAYTKSITLWPNYVEALSNMGVALQDQGKLEEAMEVYNKILAINPDFAEVHNNIGIIFKDQGKLEEAIDAHKKALAIKPDYAEAYNNMGVALKDQGKLEEAIEAYNKTLAIKPDCTEALYNMGDSLKGIVFKKPNPSLQKAIILLLDEKSFVRPQQIASAAISLLMFEPKLNRHLQTSSVAELIPKVTAIITDLSELPLLLKLMSVCPLPDLDLEDLFKELRAILLLSISDLTGSAQELEFRSALALQCFTNEYIYNQSEYEDKALAALEVAVKQALSKGEQPSPQSILCLASYKPLNQYKWSSALLINDEIEDIFTRQVAEPNQEAKFKSVLPTLEGITDPVSSKVRDQYEASPYPRWVNLRLPLKPESISQVVDKIRLKLFDDGITEIEAPDILIAGCGTGQHSITTAARFEGSKVLAIDLSLASLSYAKRKTEELNIQNIDYMQADILDLGKLGRQFDIVESSGVLHHMDDPVAGWRVLTDYLKSGGLMRIGLYSELARQNHIAIRAEIYDSDIKHTRKEMKLFRKNLVKSPKQHHKAIKLRRDFYSLSNFRDMLFHVQEHRFTIPQIQDCLSELGLKFCGFETDKIVSHFKQTNAGAVDPYNLDKWHIYEVANPRVFGGMYQFWCQKIT